MIRPIFIMMFACTVLLGASLEKAKMLNRHGLLKEARLELINVIHSKVPDIQKASAYYELGNIAFEQNQLSLAVETWTDLVEKYPSTKFATELKGRLLELSERIVEISRKTIKNSTALSYIKNGDFWTKGRGERFLIDNSWLPTVESANKWYDKTIAEFPNTAAAKVAYEEKIKTLLGWKERGQYGSSYGVEKSFKKYMPLVVAAFEEYEKAFPSSGMLQPLRYQIAQAYWGNRKWDETRAWLNIIIEKAGNKDSFYKDLAQRRLEKVEY